MMSILLENLNVLEISILFSGRCTYDHLFYIYNELLNLYILSGARLSVYLWSEQ